MCIRDSRAGLRDQHLMVQALDGVVIQQRLRDATPDAPPLAVSYTHLRAHETVLELVCRLLLEKKI